MEGFQKYLEFILLFINVWFDNTIEFVINESGHSLKDGLTYVLRKVDVTLRVNVEFALKVFEKWKAIQCSSITSFREVFRSSRMNLHQHKDIDLSFSIP
jgi:hypothetical protein